MYLKKLRDQINNRIQRNIAWMLPVATFVVVIVLIVSFLVPKKVIDTYKTNMTEEDGDVEYLVPLKSDSIISYHMNTGTRPIVGIHIGVAKNGNVFQTGKLICNVYLSDQMKAVSKNTYLLSQGEDMQYIYIPFQNYESCIGDISIEISYDAEGEMAEMFPSILANGRQITDAYTQIDGKTIEGNIKSIYIYTHNTYPLIYDLRILAVLLGAASMAVPYRKIRKWSRRGENEADNQ